jgi:dTDP-4-dehydrorhamnose reductase
MRVLILGTSGMLGNAMFRIFSELPEHEVFGTARSASARRHFSAVLGENIVCGVDVENHDSLARLFGQVRPEFVINCIGVVKQLAESEDPLLTIPINSLLPHRLAALCKIAGARLVQVSTDCVFSGEKGGYVESDFPDAHDLYGHSKLLGEVDYPHAITLRTSIIGHELDGKRSLVNWFLSQEGTVKGFTRAIFSGLPTVVLARLVRDVILPRPELHGLYHVAAAPIAKFDLITLIARVYGKHITIRPDEELVIDRSLDASRLRQETGYVAPPWEELIRAMHAFH